MSALQPYQATSADVLQMKREALYEQQQALKERQHALELQVAAASLEEDNRVMAIRLQEERDLLEAKERNLRISQEELDKETNERHRDLEDRLKALQQREAEMQLELQLAKEKIEIAALRQEKELHELAAKKEAERQAEHDRVMKEYAQKKAAVEVEDARKALEHAQKEEAVKREEARLTLSRLEQAELLETEKRRLAREHEAAIQAEKDRLQQENERITKEAISKLKKEFETTMALKEERTRLDDAQKALELSEREELLKKQEHHLAKERAQQAEELDSERTRLAKEQELVLKTARMIAAEEREKMVKEFIEDEKVKLMLEHQAVLRAEKIRLQEEQEKRIQELVASERARLFEEHDITLRVEKARLHEEHTKLANEAEELHAEKTRLSKEQEIILKVEQRLLHENEKEIEWVKQRASLMEACAVDHLRLQQAHLDQMQSLFFGWSADLLAKLQDKTSLLQEQEKSVLEAEARIDELRHEQIKLLRQLESRQDALKLDEERLISRQAALEEDIAMQERQHRIRMELVDVRETELEQEVAKQRRALEDQELEFDHRKAKLEMEGAVHLEDHLHGSLLLLREEEAELRGRVQQLADEELEMKGRLNRLRHDEEVMAQAFKEKVQRWKEEEARLAEDVAVTDRRLQIRDVERSRAHTRGEPMTEPPELLRYAIVRQKHALDANSPYKAKAKVLGWLEPVLLLAAMGEWDRVFVKRQLLVNLEADQSDPFFVAYQLITDRSHGLAHEVELESVAHGTPVEARLGCWYDALCETLRRSMAQPRTFHERTSNEKLKECDDPHSRVILELERVAFKVMEKQVEAALSDVHKATCRAILSTSRAAWLKANLRAANLSEFDALWIALAVLYSERPPQLMDEMELDEPEFWAFSGSQTGNILRTKSALVNVVFRLLITRLEFAGKGIDLAPYFNAASTPLLM